ncbi:MAG: hypothetical protein AAF918_01865 [Pseudomonadota bacterium]
MVILRRFVAFAVAVALTLALASAAATQGALAALAPLEVSAPVSFALRLETTLSDFLGLLAVGTVPVAVTVALALGWSIAGLVLWRLPSTRAEALRGLGYILAGALAMMAMHVLLRLAFDGIVPMAATRTTLGLLLQGVAGAIGGGIFAYLTRAPRSAVAP